MITIVRTSHIAPVSLEKVRDVVAEADVVAVELDPVRYAALRHPRKGSPPGLFLKVLSYLQARLGKATGVTPGKEMLVAVDEAQRQGISAYLIDQDIRITMERLQAIPVLEKVKIFIPMFFGQSVDITKIPNERMVEHVLATMKTRTPNIHRVLVQERNAYMAAWVVKLRKQFKDVVVVVGAGHAKGLAKLLKAKKLKVRIV